MTAGAAARPTRRRATAIATSLDDTLIVEAAAGTGKTTELVNRILASSPTGRAEVGEIVAVTFTEKAAGELKLRLRERLERARTARAPTPSGGRGSTTRSRASKRRTSAPSTASAPTCCASGRSRRASIRCSSVLTEPASARLFDEAFGRWLQEQLEDPPEGVRRALRRSARSAATTGPSIGCGRAAWDLAQWRDFTGAVDAAAVRSRRRDRRRGRGAARARRRSRAAPVDQRRPAVRRHRAGPAAERRDRAPALVRRRRSGGGSTTAGKRRWSICRAIATFANAKRAAARRYGDGVARDRVLEARDALQGAARAVPAGRRCRPRRAAAAGAARRDRPLRRAEGPRRRARLPRSAARRARPGARQRDGRGAASRRGSSGSSSTSSRTPIRSRRRSSCCSRPTTTSETDWRRARPRPGKLFIVGDPKQSIYRFRRADVGIYREVCDRLDRARARRVLQLNTSFRSVPEIQRCVNAAFAPVMTGDPRDAAGAATCRWRRIGRRCPGSRRSSRCRCPSPTSGATSAPRAIEQSLPDAVGAFVDWLVRESGWTVTERSGEAPVERRREHICLLFRRFVSWQNDVTRPYVDALEARGIPHLLVGGKAFHEREEVETIRAALAAIEWPDDELSVFATLRGPLFAIGDEALLEYAPLRDATPHGFRRHALHPFRVPPAFDGEVPEAIGTSSRSPTALRAPQAAAPARATTCRSPTRCTSCSTRRARTSASCCGRPASRRSPTCCTSPSWRASTRRAAASRSAASSRSCASAAENAVAAEAPILEEGSDGVRLMTVHKAKGLEFPVVILADLTCKLSQSRGRPLDRSRIAEPVRAEARRLGADDLLLHDAEEVGARSRGRASASPTSRRRARATCWSSRRSATRSTKEAGSIRSCRRSTRRSARAVIRRRRRGCPAFPSKDTVLTRGGRRPRPGDDRRARDVRVPGRAGRGNAGPGARRPAPGRRQPGIRNRRPDPGRPACAQVPVRAAGSRSRSRSRLDPPDRRAPTAERRGAGSPIPDPGSRLDPADRRARSAERRPDPGSGSRIPDNGKYQVVWWDPHSLVAAGAPRRRAAARRPDRQGRRPGLGRAADGRVPRLAGGPRGGYRPRQSAEHRVADSDAIWPAIARCRRGQTMCRSR